MRSRTEARFSCAASAPRTDADDVVPLAEQQLGEIRAVLPGCARDESATAQCNPLTYVQASLRPSERSTYISAA